MIKAPKLFSPNNSSAFNLSDRISIAEFKEFESRYETFFDIPVVTKGWIAKSSSMKSTADAIYICKSQRNTRQKKKRSLLETYVKAENSNSNECTVNPYQRLPWFWNISGSSVHPSPSKQRFAMISKLEDAKTKKSQSVIEIYNDSQLLQTVIAPKNSFGDIHTSGQFSGFCWSPNEKYIAFIAERNEEKESKNFFEDASMIKKYSQLEEELLKKNKKKENDNENEDSSKEEPTKEKIGHSYEWKETFGEQMNGAADTSLFIYDIDNNCVIDINEYDVIPKNIVLGDVQFTPDSKSLIVVAYDTYPRRLGIKFYNTRPSQLWCIRLPDSILDKDFSACSFKDVSKESEDNKDAKVDEENANSENKNECDEPWPLIINLAPNDPTPQSPRFSPNGKQLLYLTTKKSFAHRAAAKLQSIAWPPISAENIIIRTVIGFCGAQLTSRDVIQDNQFPGIWALAPLKNNCFVDENTLVMCSLWTHEIVILSIDISDSEEKDNNDCCQRLDVRPEMKEFFAGKTEFIANENSRSFYILDVDIANHEILFMVSSMQRGQSVYIYNLVNKSVYNLCNMMESLFCKGGNIDGNDKQLLQSVPNIITHVIEIESYDKNVVYECFLLLPPPGMTSFEENPILILYPHGGPHSASTARFSSHISSMLYSGFAILQVNYRGSIGICDTFADALLGNVGDMDVKDCIHAFDYVVDKYFTSHGMQNVKKLITGGSHGGFLTTHIIGQYPNKFLCALAENPVTNLASMFSLTDIPDWCLLEALGESGINFDNYPQSMMTSVTVAQLATMYERSPHFHINKVCIPLQIHIGGKDQRCPMQQSIEYFKILRARNGNSMARLLFYDECQHSLSDKMDQEFDVYCNIWAWFYYHTRDTTGKGDDVNTNGKKNKCQVEESNINEPAVVVEVD